MHVKHAALLKLKHAALFLIMQLVLGLIMLRVSIMLRVDLAHRLPHRLPLISTQITPDNFPATKKDRTRFSHTVSLQYFSLGIR